jgi:hypothetical protein
MDDAVSLPDVRHRVTTHARRAIRLFMALPTTQPASGASWSDERALHHEHRPNAAPSRRDSAFT